MIFIHTLVTPIHERQSKVHQPCHHALCTALEILLSVHLGSSERQKPLQILILWAAVSVPGAILTDSATKIRSTNTQF